MVPVIEEKQKDAAADSPVPVKTKRVTRKFELNVETISQSLSKPVLESFRNLEINLESSDKLVLDTSEKRNQLEEYVYDTRSSLEMPWSDFISDDQKSVFMKLLNEMENWLYTEEGESATKSIYMEKLAGLKKIGDPIHKRLVEFETRPLAERTFKEYVNGVVASLGDEKFEHISKSDLDIVRSECKSKMDWLNDAIGKQNEISKAADCVVTVDEINRNKDALAFKVNPILNKPKPKSEVKKENEEPVAKKESKENDSAKDVAMDGTDEPVADTTDMPQAMEVD